MAAALDPVWIMRASEKEPDSWQAAFLRSHRKRMLISASRQSGKSTATAAKALHVALFVSGALVLLMSKSQKQASELLRKVKEFHRPFKEAFPVRAESVLQFELKNNSRVLSLPSDEGTVRGYSGADLVVIDEASRVADAVFNSATPMLGVSQGALVLLSTPYGRRGFFYNEWEHGGDEWERFKTTASDCPRYTEDFLALERKRMGPRQFEEEYGGAFVEDLEDARNPRVFSGNERLLDEIFSDDIPVISAKKGENP